MALRSVAQRAGPVLREPPDVLRRCTRADWRGHASSEAVATLDRCRNTLRDALSSAADAWKLGNRVDMDSLARATGDAETVVRDVRASAISGAQRLSWHQVLNSTQLVRVDGSASDDSADSLGGKVVALYFTASWCGPCRRFSPYLVELYERVRALRQRDRSSTATPFEVVLVSWDEVRDERDAYVRAHGMQWMAVPHSARALADELTLRYDVTHIPSLVVLEVSADGREARVLSREGRDDLARGSAGWLKKIGA